ncbi:hypothetical protein M405DRAFT_928250 [Rhizopogon salebrosus TDB-379]|nr:hypothetical protein M405DRAFT_928250 [Rhizopogon salebrosus TDB-379]
MHRALFISEILLEVFTHLIPEQPRDKKSAAIRQVFFLATEPLSPANVSSRKSLAWLARTCKTFHEPAMDLLWADMDDYGLEPLLGCVKRLHPLVYPLIRDRYGTLTVRKTWSEGVKPLFEQEACQFLRHAARVRYLSIWTEDSFHLLTIFPIEARIFPRLLALEWRPKTNARLHLFLPPTLRRCILTVLDSELESILTCCHGLETLSTWDQLDGEHSRTDDLSLLSEAVRLCKRLKHLQCPSLDSAGWNHLSNLPNLVTVMIYGQLTKVPLNLDKVVFKPFLNVTTLLFSLESATDVITIMQHSEFPSLKKFRAFVSFLPLSEAEQLVHALTRCRSCDTLEYIHIYIRDQTDEHPDKTLAVIKPLLCFSQLRTLELHLRSSVYLDNDLLFEAMSSWPHIQAMKIDSRKFYDQPEGPLPTVTFRGLFAGLRLCPDLHTLCLDMDAINIDIDPEIESFQHASLRRLNVGSSIAENAGALAHIILAMLPCIEDIEHHSQRSGSVWEKVGRIIELENEKGSSSE